MRKSIYLSIILLLAAFHGFSQSSTQTFTTSESAQLEVELKPDKDTIMLGETTFISFEIKNFSDRNLFTSVGGDYRNNVGRPDSYKVTVVRDDGKPVPQPEVKFWMGGLSGRGYIKPKSSYVTKLFLPHWATFSEPGTYQITVKKSISIQDDAASKTPEKTNDVFKAEVRTTIKIIPTDNEKLGVVIDSLGKTLVDAENPDNQSALSILFFINDKRAIPYFAEILGKSDNYFLLQNSARGLARFDSEGAWKALEKAIPNESDDVRFAVADALEMSKSLKALELILRMKNDSYWFVRLRVVQAFGAVKTREATELFREMLKDENESVRKQAQEYLDVREQK